MLGKKILRRTFSAAVYIILAFAVWSCGKGADSDNKVWFRGGSEVGYEAGRQVIEVVSEGEWELSLSFEDPSAGEWCKLNVVSGYGNSVASMNYDANAGETRTADLTARFAGGESVTVRFTQLSKEGQGGTLDTYLEFPSLPDNGTLPDSLRLVTHFVPGNETMRNYSILYDVVNHIPVWVAYPMHDIYVRRDVGRSDAWQFDPVIPRAEQPDMSRGIGSGYSRGHMLPSASRYLRWGGSDVMSTNEQTFFFTNMTPQIYSFNGNLWANMESYVRGWRGSGTDTLYVVTGAVLTRVDTGEGAVRHITTDNKKVAVPNYYYKALLKRSVSGGEIKYKGVAFWFDHKTYDRSTVDWAGDAISIDELERRTGIDFFSGLDEQVQEQVESKRNAADWGFRPG